MWMKCLTNYCFTYLHFIHICSCIHSATTYFYQWSTKDDKLDHVVRQSVISKKICNSWSSLRLKLSPDKQVTVTLETPLPECYIHDERNRISQIIINPETNAIKFTKRTTFVQTMKYVITKRLIFTGQIPAATFRRTSKKVHSDVLSNWTTSCTRYRPGPPLPDSHSANGKWLHAYGMEKRQ